MPATMRELLAAAEGPLILPSVYDGISATAARAAGFEAGFVGSHAASAAKWGLTDTGFISLEDMAELTRRIQAVFDVPLMVDAEGGWGNPVHVARAVRHLERAGASMIQIEDEIFGKHIAPQTVLPLNLAVDKIKAAVDARASDDTMILARTDVAGVEGLEAAFDRVLAFRDAGADAFTVPLPKIDPQRLAAVRAESGIPGVAVNQVGLSADESAGGVFDMIVYYGSTQLVAASAISSMLRTLQQTRTTVGMEDGWMSMSEVDELLGLDRVRREAIEYGLVPADAGDFFTHLGALGEGDGVQK